MGSGAMNNSLPPGFVLDQASTTALPDGFMLDQAAPAPDIGENRQSTIAALRGIPVLGAYVDKGTAALNAAAQPFTETGLSHADTFSQRMAENEPKIKSAVDAYEASHPIGTTIGKAVLGTVAMAPAMVAAPEVFGLEGATLAGRAAAGAASGGALGGADALARGENPASGAALGAILGGAGPVAGRAVGKVVQGARDLINPASEAIPSAAAIKDAATSGYDAIRDAGVTVNPKSVQDLAAGMRKDFRDEGFRDYLAPKTFGVLDELEHGQDFTSPADGLNATGQLARDVADIRQKYGDQAATEFLKQQQAPQVAPGPAIQAAPSELVAPATPKAQSLTQFIASKGGLGPDAELDAIGAHTHTVNVDGAGRRKLVRQGGWPLDYAREAAEEAGYLRPGSTPNDLLDAIDGEMRGQKLYPAGHEGTVGKRDASLLSEREQYEQDAHFRGLEDDLSAAGHGELNPDVKQRAVHLMANEGMDANTAVEHAFSQLEQEDAAAGASHEASFPGDRVAPSRPAGPSAPSRIVSFADLHGLRRALGKAAQSADPTERGAASRAMSRLDNYLGNIPESDVLGGDAGRAAQLLKTANENYTVAKLAERLQGKIGAAELQAGSANSGANLENALRQRVKDILKSPKLSQGFTQDEKLMMQRIVRGSAPSNVVRWIGNYLGGGGGLGALASGGAGFLAGGPAGALLAPAAGFAAKKLGSRMTEAQLAKLDTMIRARAPASAQAKLVTDALENARQVRLAAGQRRGAIAARAAAPLVSGLRDDQRERRR